MSSSPIRRPLRSIGQASQTSSVHHAVQPGHAYWLACRRRAVLLAHSREKAISQDPTLDDGSPFRDLPFRALHRLGEHRLRALYEDVLFPRLAAIIQQSGLPWSAFGTYRQGWSSKAEGSVPTLAVWCVTMGRPDDAILRNAQGLADTLDDLLLQHGLEDVHVEVAAQYRHGPVGVAYNSADDSPALAVYHPFLPGNSVGPQGATGSGTFSGYVRVQRGAVAVVQSHGAGPDADIFGLTCHHVAAMAQEDPMVALARSDGVQLNSPAAVDHAQTVEEKQTFVETTRHRIAELETEREERAMIGKPWTPYRQGLLEDATQQLQHCQEVQQYVKACWETDALLGRVLLSSGARMPPEGQAMEDWALVELNQTALQQRDRGNRPPVHVFTQYHNNAKQICGDCAVKEFPMSILDLLIDIDTCGQHNDDTLPTVAELLALAQQRENPTHVVLRGRSTPFGIGVLHDMRDGVRTTYGQTEMVSRELTALDVSRRSFYSSHVLSRRGDSGAPVRTTDGRLVGFVLSSNPDDSEGQPTTHIAVAEMVAANIQRATGAESVTFVGRDEAVSA